eukprot:scaffold21.g2152.t1
MQRRALTLGLRALGRACNSSSLSASGALPSYLAALSLLSEQARGPRPTCDAWRSGAPPAAAYASAAVMQPVEAIQQFRLAQTGEGIKECELVQWFVAEGEAVEEFGRICEVQSDKATIEITSPYAGIVRRLHHAAGDVVQVGEVLADIEADGDYPAGAGGAPELSLAAPPYGTAGGAAAAVSDAYAPAVNGAAMAAGVAVSTSGSIGGDEVADRVLTSPAVRRLAREHGLDLRAVKGTGPEGRVTKADVLAYLDSLAAAAGTPVGEEVVRAIPSTEEGGVAAAAATAAPAPHVARPLAPPASAQPPAPARPPAPWPAGAEEEALPQPIIVPLRGYRKAMLRSMAAAAAVDALVELRDALRGDPALAGARLTFLPFLMKAAALAIRQVPLVNASLAEDQSAILEHSHVNLGVAMATPHGLVVPNIKHSKSIADIAQELGRLQAAAAANQLRPADLAGGTFTLSNIGSIGGTYATPLINPPEVCRCRVAILAVGRVARVPRLTLDESGIAPASVLNISLGADHRVVDGATLAGFARAFRGFVESPGSLLLHLR